MKFTRKLPVNWFPPRLVTALITPPLKRPYSAEIAGGEDLGLLHRVLDEEVVRAAEEVVVDVHAVEQEHVVVGEAARDVDLAGVGRALRR